MRPNGVSYRSNGGSVYVHATGVAYTSVEGGGIYPMVQNSKGAKMTNTSNGPITVN